MKKIIALALAAVTSMVVFAGCTTCMSYTFNVETGDAVKVELDTTDGLKLSQNDGTFVVTKDQGFSLPKTWRLNPLRLLN